MNEVGSTGVAGTLKGCAARVGRCHVLAAVVFATLTLAAGRVAPLAAGQAATSAQTARRIERGSYLVKVAACNDCHTPWKIGAAGPAPDMTQMLSGHPAGLAMPSAPMMLLPWVASASATNTAWASALGVAFAANLTPHATGLGGWTEQQFAAAMRTGRHKGSGRQILPPMPVSALRRMTDEDLVSIFTYLRSIPAIDNAVPEAIVSSGPAALQAPVGPVASTAVKGRAAPATDAVSRGKYLVDVIGCTDCHTPSRLSDKGLEPDTSRLFSGYPASEKIPAPRQTPPPWAVHMTSTQASSGPWGISLAANLTPDEETGIGSWTEAQFVDTIRNGRHQGRGRQLLPPMPWPAFAQMHDADLKAVFAYLRTLPKVRNRVPEPVLPAAGGQ